MDAYKLKRTSISPIVGIYFLFNKKELVYIGKSTDIVARIQQHKVDKVFTHYSYFKCPRKNLDILERLNIKKYNPKLNTVHARTDDKQLNALEIEYASLISSIPDNGGYLSESLFICKISGKVTISKVKVTRRRGYRYYNLVDIKGEITGNGSVDIKSCTVTIKLSKTYYFLPNGYYLKLSE